MDILLNTLVENMRGQKKRKKKPNLIWTGVQTSAVEAVMDGDLDAFIKAYLMEYGAEA